jgi:nucleoside 2-deoxyribosyltransferase
MTKRKFDLPPQIERLLASLSKLYAQDGERELQELIVNAQVRIHEEWTYDNLDGGTFGHALYLTVPDSLFLRVAKKRDKIQRRIRDDLDSLHHVQQEHFAAVFLEMDAPADADWRLESGLSLTTNRVVGKAAAKRIWEDGRFRVFLSHKSAVKKQVAALKEKLRLFGISCFVAHEDVNPTKEWQNEIENALASMDAFVALLTRDFHDSEWTDQEVGYALARAVPLIAVRLERNPYGFIGKFQALAAKWDEAPAGIARVLLKQDRMVSAYIAAAKGCTSFDNGNILAEGLSAIERLSEKQVDELVAAYNTNGQLRGSFGFNGTRPVTFGKGLVFHLNRLSERQFTFNKSMLIEEKIPF